MQFGTLASRWHPRNI